MKKTTVEKTAIKTSLDGEKLYQQRARKALPLLVRQAKAEHTIYYSDLAQELKMPNPRNLNYVLGTIGNALIQLGKLHRRDIPPIQSLVINKNTNMPGEGFEGFLPDVTAFRKSSSRRKRMIIHQLHDNIFQYDKWDYVLEFFNLKPVKVKWISTKDPSKKRKGGKYGKGGESQEHKKLKKIISENPSIIGLPVQTRPGKIEYEFPSADTIDVMFSNGDELVGVEVKSINSGENDIARGIYQCVKYKALIDAIQMVNQNGPKSRAVLVIEGELPPDIIELKNILAVEVIEIEPLK
ncbi:hypothetical protein KA005_57910 [bacterium]|nr:hypothetical protein [bacterium]